MGFSGPNQKRMACVGAVYSIEPFVRKADDIIDEVLRDRKAKERPEPQHKHVWAEMTRQVGGETIHAKEALFAHLESEAAARNSGHDRPVICPFCGSDETELYSLFGSTLLLTQHYCRACQTVFERIREDEPEA